MARFAPGQSGNPGGRPTALREVEEEAQIDAARDADSRHHRWRPQGSARSACYRVVILLERGWGIARQQMEVNPFDEFETRSEEELRVFVLEGAAKIEAEDRCHRHRC